MIAGELISIDWNEIDGRFSLFVTANLKHISLSNCMNMAHVTRFSEYYAFPDLCVNVPPSIRHLPSTDPVHL